MNYISQKISQIFKLDYFVSMLKFDFDIKKVVSLLSVMVMSYVVLIPTYNLIMRLVKGSNKKSDEKSDKKSDEKSSIETLTYRKYRNIDYSSCSGCASDSSSKSSKSKCINKKKVDSVLRKFKITE